VVEPLRKKKTKKNKGQDFMLKIRQNDWASWMGSTEYGYKSEGWGVLFRIKKSPSKEVWVGVRGKH